MEVFTYEKGSVVYLIAFILIAAVCVIFYFTPDKSPAGDPPVANGEYFFTASITEVHENYLLVEVTNFIKPLRPSSVLLKTPASSRTSMNTLPTSFSII